MIFNLSLILPVILLIDFLTSLLVLLSPIWQLSNVLDTTGMTNSSPDIQEIFLLKIFLITHLLCLICTFISLFIYCLNNKRKIYFFAIFLCSVVSSIVTIIWIWLIFFSQELSDKKYAFRLLELMYDPQKKTLIAYTLIFSFVLLNHWFHRRK